MTTYSRQYFRPGIMGALLTGSARDPAGMSSASLRRFVIQVLSEPSLDFVNVQAFTLTVIGNLITLNLTQTEIARFRMGEVKAAHARSRPHRVRLRDLNSCIRLDAEQAPQCALLGVVGAGRVSCGGPNAAIFFVNKVFDAQVLGRAVAPFIADAFVQAFGKSLSQAIRKSLSHDRVVVIVLGSIAIAEFLQSDAAGHCECADVIAQPGHLWRNEVGKRPAGFASFSVGLLPEKMKPFAHFGP